MGGDMAIKEIICCHCKKSISTTGGFYHDENLNMFCGNCNGLVFPVIKQLEDKHRLAFQQGNISPHDWYRKDALPIKINTSSLPPIE